MTAISRRTILRGSVVAVVAAPFLSIEEALGAPAPTNLLARSRFTPYVGATFKMVTATASWTVTLTRIADLQPLRVAGDESRFSLTFQASSAGPPQGAYSFRRAGFTSTSLFVVPSDVNRRNYQAIINRAF